MAPGKALPHAHQGLVHARPQEQERDREEGDGFVSAPHGPGWSCGQGPRRALGNAELRGPLRPLRAASCRLCLPSALSVGQEAMPTAPPRDTCPEPFGEVTYLAQAWRSTWARIRRGGCRAGPHLSHTCQGHVLGVHGLRRPQPTSLSVLEVTAKSQIKSLNPTF